MSVEQLISPIVPALSLSDTGSRALELMDENKLAQLPVVSDEHYVALIKENDLLEMDDPDAALSSLSFLNFKPSVFNSAHPYDALKIMTQFRLAVLPVTDAEEKYVGAVTADTLLDYLSNRSSLGISGGIVVLEVTPHNYTLYDIARLFENEDVTIVNTQLYTAPDGTMEVTLKTNRSDLDAVVSSLERHKYVVKEIFGDLKSQEDVMGKYNLFMNYLNM